MHCVPFRQKKGGEERRKDSLFSLPPFLPLPNLVAEGANTACNILGARHSLCVCVHVNVPKWEERAPLSHEHAYVHNLWSASCPLSSPHLSICREKRWRKR